MLGLHKSDSFHPLAGFSWLGSQADVVNTWSFPLSFQEAVGLACSIALARLVWEMLLERMVFNCSHTPREENWDSSWQGPSVPGGRWRIRFFYCLVSSPSWCPEDFALQIPSAKLCSWGCNLQQTLCGWVSSQQSDANPSTEPTALLSQGWCKDKTNYS